MESGITLFEYSSIVITQLQPIPKHIDLNNIIKIILYDYDLGCSTEQCVDHCLYEIQRLTGFSY